MGRLVLSISKHVPQTKASLGHVKMMLMKMKTTMTMTMTVAKIRKFQLGTLMYAANKCWDELE